MTPTTAAPASQRQVQAVGVVDQVGAPAPTAGPPRPAAPSWTSWRAHHQQHVALRRPPSSPPPGGWWWRSRCLPCAARRSPGSAARSAATISAVSSTDSVVWVTKASVGRIARRERLGVGHGLDQRDRARRAAGPWCRPPRDGRRGRSARSRGPRRSAARPRRAPWRPAGRWRRRRSSCGALASAGTALGTPCAENTTGRSVGQLVQFLDEHRAQRLAGARPRGGCGRSRGAHRPARRTSRCARSTIWMARSTPAQKPRGVASSTVIGGLEASGRGHAAKVSGPACAASRVAAAFARLY